MGEMIQPDFRKLQKAMRQPVQSERKNACGLVPQIEEVRLKIVGLWRRRRMIKSIAAEVGTTYQAIETVLQEEIFGNVIPFPGPNGSGPNPTPPAASRLSNEGGADDSMLAAKRSKRKVA